MSLAFLCQHLHLPDSSHKHNLFQFSLTSIIILYTVNFRTPIVGRVHGVCLHEIRQSLSKSEYEQAIEGRHLRQSYVKVQQLADELVVRYEVVTQISLGYFHWRPLIVVN